MQFGQLPSAQLNTTDFSLQNDSVFTKKTLASARVSSSPTIYVGCAKWGRKEWIGKIYPGGTKEINFLDHYVNHFNSIELNATHYKVYGPETISKWSEKAGSRDFKFCPKVPKSISHYSNLVSEKAVEVTAKFVKGIIAFGPHLGPVFLQLNDKFSPADKGNLYQYLENLPAGIEFFVELRHPDWFADKVTRKDLLETLQKHHTGLVITDTAARRDCVHMELTVPTAFVRFDGNKLHPTDYSRIDLWVRRIRDWLGKGLQEVYFFLHQPDEEYSPELCNYAAEQFNKYCHTKLILPLKVQ
jgi:uncharacterized protein YecE (DUF72 family)